jgi:hypothetical protein
MYIALRETPRSTVPTTTIRPRSREILAANSTGSADGLAAVIIATSARRQKLTMRMAIRRFTRLTNAFSKKLANLKAACALHFAYYNFCRVHASLRVTPAMEAGLADHIWTIGELVEALP